MCSCNRPISCFSDPLLSTLLTFFALILLCFPRLFWRLLLSPVLLLTGLLLLCLLRLGATQRFRRHINDNNPTISEIETRESTVANDAAEEDRGRENAVESKLGGGGGNENDVSCACFEESFVQWNVRAPLEVIYEEYEEEDVSNESDPFTETEPRQAVRIERYPSLSLSLYYPETDDSDSSSDDELPTAGAWDSLDNLCFMWDDGEDRDELIEIALDKTNKMKASSELFQLEEENLIEIDIFPTIEKL